jgi:hypothetical protein
MRAMLDAEARVPPLRPPGVADGAFDPFLGSPREELIEDATRNLDEKVSSLAPDDGAAASGPDAEN